MTSEATVQQFAEATLDFMVTADMVERFARLTGDQSSLHVNADFGRTSLYRQNVVHGMLPVSFLAALPLVPEGLHYALTKISGKFIKPVFVGDALRVSAKLSAERDDDCLDWQYRITQRHSGSVVTTGRFTMRVVTSIGNIPGETTAVRTNRRLPPGGRSLVVENLTEQTWDFARIRKGMTADFAFRMSAGTLSDYFTILNHGIDAFTTAYQDWVQHPGVRQLLTNCLLSTHVGMSIPGRTATFVDFMSDFARDIDNDELYRFAGEVVFKSGSAQAIVQNISVMPSTDALSPAMTSRIMVKVNEAERQMPMLQDLMEQHFDLNLRGKVALVTGASRGLGETTVKLLALHGVKVVVNYLNSEARAKQIVEEIREQGGKAISARADVSDDLQVKAMVAAISREFGPVDILINNAVRDAYPAAFTDLTWDQVQKDFDIVVKGAFNCCQAVLPGMIGKQGGKIINISTVFTDAPEPGQAKYIMAKSALVGLTRSLAVEMAKHQIQVNMVVPSIVETDLSKHVAKVFMEDMKRSTPMKRHATPVDVARAVVFLASSLSSFTTGQKIMVTGGNHPFL